MLTFLKTLDLSCLLFENSISYLCEFSFMTKQVFTQIIGYNNIAKLIALHHLRNNFAKLHQRRKSFFANFAIQYKETRTSKYHKFLLFKKFQFCYCVLSFFLKFEKLTHCGIRSCRTIIFACKTPYLTLFELMCSFLQTIATHFQTIRSEIR